MISTIERLLNRFDLVLKNGSVFNQPIGNWNVSKVQNMSYMFAKAEFNQPIGNWDVSGVRWIQQMFAPRIYCKINFKQDINNWRLMSLETSWRMFCINTEKPPEKDFVLPIWYSERVEDIQNFMKKKLNYENLASNLPVNSSVQKKIKI